MLILHYISSEAFLYPIISVNTMGSILFSLVEAGAVVSLPLENSKGRDSK